MNKTFFTSDNHFGHRSILKFCPKTRQGRDVDEMNELMILAWNKQVGVNDYVYMLGDFSFLTTDKTNEVLARLNGVKHLVLGNHDKWVDNSSFNSASRLQWAQPYKKLKINNQSFILFHYPIYEWEDMHKGSIHLYGHVHGRVKLEGKAMDAGIDARRHGDMRLFELDEIVELMKNKEVRTHHNKRAT